MAINVSQAFHRTSANPVDESMALTKAQMLTVNDNLMPAYYFTICQDDGEIYLYNKAAAPSSTTGKFTKFEGGGGQGSGGITIDATLLASGWDSNTKQQTITFSGYETSMGGVIGMPTSATSAQKEAYANAKINVVSQSGASFTFECEEIPEVNLPVTLYAGGSGSGGADLPSGGTTGQALVKHSNTDQDVEWATINSLPDGGTAGQVLAKHSATNKDVEWVDQIDTQKEIKDNGTAVTDRSTLNFTDFDISDDSTNEETDIKAHRLTSAEMADIMSTLPGATTQYPKYSTTEQVVGEWIDGKPLYQKTVIMTMPTSSTKHAITPISDCDILFVVWAFEYSSNATMNMYPAYGNDAKLHGSVWTTDSHHADGGRIILQADDNTWAGVTVYVTVQYTKTTD